MGWVCLIHLVPTKHFQGAYLSVFGVWVEIVNYTVSRGSPIVSSGLFPCPCCTTGPPGSLSSRFSFFFLFLSPSQWSSSTKGCAFATTRFVGRFRPLMPAVAHLVLQIVPLNFHAFLIHLVYSSPWLIFRLPVLLGYWILDEDAVSWVKYGKQGRERPFVLSFCISA